jgi:hypothetical protein
MRPATQPAKSQGSRCSAKAATVAISALPICLERRISPHGGSAEDLHVVCHDYTTNWWCFVIVELSRSESMRSERCSSPHGTASSCRAVSYLPGKQYAPPRKLYGAVRSRSWSIWSGTSPATVC